MIDICNSADAGYFIQSAVRSHADSWQRMDNIEDTLIRLVKPFDENELRNAGFSWAANFNFGKGRAKVEADVAQNVADVINSLSFMRSEFRAMTKADREDKFYVFLEDENLKVRFQDTIINCFLDALDKDNYTGSFINRTEYCTYVFGHCSVTRDVFGYMGYPNHPRSIAYEDRTEITNIRNFCLFDVLKAEFLYNELVTLGKFSPDELQTITTDFPIGGPNNPISAASPNEYTYTVGKDGGWIKEGLIEVFRNALISSSVNQDKDSEGKERLISQFESWQDIQTFVMRYGLPFLYSNVNNIFICKIYYFDDDNDYIEVYVAVTGDVLSRNITVPSTNKFLLYKKNWGKKSIDKVINVIRESTLNVNDWIHELKGAGKMIAEDSLRYDLKKCKLEDRLTINGCAVVRTNSEFQANQLKMVVMAGLAVPESGVTFDESPFKADLTQFVQSIQFDEANFSRDTQHLAPQVSDQLHSRATTEEVQQVSSEVSRQAGSKVPLKFKDYSTVFFNALLDLVNNKDMEGNNKDIQDYFFSLVREALADLAELTDEEITKIVNCVVRVRFTPVIKDVNSIKEAMELTGNSDQRVRLQKMLLMALGFTRKDVNDLVEAQDYGVQVSLAAIENDMFSRTAEVAFGTNQDHITHLNTHYPKFDRMLQSAAQGGDLMAAFNTLTNGLTNCQAHLGAIQNSYFYKDQFKQYLKIQKYFTNKVIQMSQLIQQQRQQAAQQAAKSAQDQQQQQQQQPDAKTQASIYNDRIKLLDKIKRTDILTNDKRQKELQNFQMKMQLLQQETTAKINREQQLAESKKSIANMQTSIKLISDTSQQPQLNEENDPALQDATAA